MMEAEAITNVTLAELSPVGAPVTPHGRRTWHETSHCLQSQYNYAGSCSIECSPSEFEGSMEISQP